jgi:hypothetical protein
MHSIIWVKFLNPDVIRDRIKLETFTRPKDVTTCKWTCPDFVSWRLASLAPVRGPAGVHKKANA